MSKIVQLHNKMFGKVSKILDTLYRQLVTLPKNVKTLYQNQFGKKIIAFGKVTFGKMTFGEVTTKGTRGVWT